MRPKGSQAIFACRGGRGCLTLLLLLAGCAGPNHLVSQLDEKIYDQDQQIARLNAQHDADQAAMTSLQNQQGTLPTLPQSRLNQLVTANSLRIGKLTGGYPADDLGTVSQGIKVYVVPMDLQDDPVKVAGSFSVEAFDLADAQHALIGRWNFDPQQTRADWFGSGLLYTYVLTCPWQTVPQHDKLLVRVTFFDELAQRNVPVAEKNVTVKLPTTTAPTTRPEAVPAAAR